MEELGKSFHIQFASQTLNWFGSDSAKNYEINLKNDRERMERYNWIDQPITYDFNEHGFRSESFISDQDSIVFLGASDTLGTGLPLEDTWHYKVATELKLRRYNLGLGGASGNTAFRMASYWLSRLNPKIVVLMSPLNPRFELAEDIDGERFYYQLGPGMWSKDSLYWGYFKDKNLKSKFKNFYQLWTASEDNLLLQQKKNELAISKLSDDIGSKFVLADGDTDWVGANVDYARDLMHFGREGNKIVAERILSRI